MRKLLLVVTAVMATSIMNAQEFKFGAKGGLNISTFTGGDSELKKTPAIGFHIGGFAEIKLTDKFAIQPELLYSLQGAKGSKELRLESPVAISTTNASETDRFGYLNIPVMVKYFVIENLSIEAGPQLGFLINGTAKGESTTVTQTSTFAGVVTTTSTTTSEPNIKDYANTVDFGFNLGAGYELESGLLFQARYNLGLSKINKEGDNAIKNSVFQVSVGYKF